MKKGKMVGFYLSFTALTKLKQLRAEAKNLYPYRKITYGIVIEQMLNKLIMDPEANLELLREERKKILEQLCTVNVKLDQELAKVEEYKAKSDKLAEKILGVSI